MPLYPAIAAARSPHPPPLPSSSSLINSKGKLRLSSRGRGSRVPLMLTLVFAAAKFRNEECFVRKAGFGWGMAGSPNGPENKGKFVKITNNSFC